VLEVLYQCAKFGGARTSHAARGTKNVEFFVCVPVMLLNGKVLEMGKICSCAQAFRPIFVSMPLGHIGCQMRKCGKMA